MSAAREAFRARRARLVERAALERDRLAAELGGWQRSLGLVDRGLAIVNGIRKSAPGLGFCAGIAAAALAFVRPDSIGGWLRSGQHLWQVVTRRTPAPAPSPVAAEAMEPERPSSLPPA